jgi:transposase-like protein
VVQALTPRWPHAARVLAEAQDDVLASMAFPKEHWTGISSTNPLERLNREVKRRTDVVGLFPDEAAVLRLVGAVLLETDEEWQVERRSFSRESLGKLTQPFTELSPAPRPLRLAPIH